MIGSDREAGDEFVFPRAEESVGGCCQGCVLSVPLVSHWDACRAGERAKETNRESERYAYSADMTGRVTQRGLVDCLTIAWMRMAVSRWPNEVGKLR